MSSGKIHNIGAADSVEYYNAFVKRYDNPAMPVLAAAPEAADSSSLLVIDVQDDFILPPPGLPENIIPKGYTHGRFNVEDGANMTSALRDFIVSNMGNFSKVVFSRDTHTVDHCSFCAQTGPFPNHCVANHVGSKFHDDMKDAAIVAANGAKVDVIFKGCTNTTDSFGAVEYKKDAYAVRRQLGSKCNLDGFTGGKYLKNKAMNFEDYPFTSIPHYEQIDETLCPASTTENIAKDLGEQFKINHLFPGQNSGTHNVYVVGVAGDYCVKDTAMNIMKTLDNGMFDGVKVNVYILQPFVRYGFLPIQFLGGFNNVYQNAPAVKRANYTNMRPGKDINQYVFEYDPMGKKKVLSASDVTARKGEIDSIITFKDALAKYESGDMVLTALADAAASNPNVLCSFLSPVKDIIKDYSESGVKMLLDVPAHLSVKAGGARRNQRQTQRQQRQQRQSQRQNRQQRQSQRQNRQQRQSQRQNRQQRQSQRQNQRQSQRQNQRQNR